MTYAPVFIATLERQKHLQKCLESLSKCTLADQTEVYVALDYPPSDKWDKYAPGWKKNREYLHSVGDMGFKKLHLIERTENYGIWLPGHKGNLRSLIQENTKDVDFYITSEDDNVFAPCFLEYMNKGNELFKNDEDVICLTGYRLYVPNLIFKDNNFLRESVDYNAWGIGVWKHKHNKMPDINYHWYRKHLTPKYISKVYKKAGLGGVCQLVNLSCATKRTAVIDINMWTYVTLTDTQQILPRQTLVYNIGLDGSGETMSDSIGQDWTNPELNPLSTDLHFDFKGTGYEFYDENQKIYSSTKYWKSTRTYLWILFKKIIKLIIHW